jgi:hypothetical protein
MRDYAKKQSFNSEKKREARSINPIRDDEEMLNKVIETLPFEDIAPVLDLPHGRATMAGQEAIEGNLCRNKVPESSPRSVEREDLYAKCSSSDGP